MTRLLEQAIEAARKLSPERQNEVAEVILSATAASTVIITDEEHDAILQGLEDARSAAFASEKQVQTLSAQNHPA